VRSVDRVITRVGDVPILGTWLDPKRKHPVKSMTEKGGA
jgi:hypothetical protein